MTAVGMKFKITPPRGALNGSGIFVSRACQSKVGTSLRPLYPAKWDKNGGLCVGGDFRGLA